MGDDHNIDSDVVQIHAAADMSDSKLFDDFCVLNKKICDKIVFDIRYTSSQKIHYLSGSVRVVGGLANYMILWKNIIKSFNILNLQQQKITKRAWTNANSVFVNTNTISYEDEFSQLLSHEFGHIIDLYSILWSSKKKDQHFTEFERPVFAIDDPSLAFYKISREWEKVRKSTAKPGDFCSWYGMYDPFEDFAECNNLYLYHNVLFRWFAKSNSTLKKIYNYVANIYAWKYFEKGTKHISLAKSQSPSWRPWDTTRIQSP